MLDTPLEHVKAKALRAMLELVAAQFELDNAEASMEALHSCYLIIASSMEEVPDESIIFDLSGNSGEKAS